MAIRVTQNKVWLVACAIFLVMVALVASKMTFYVTTEWADNSRQQDYAHGRLFALSALLKAELPQTPQLSLRNWSQWHDSPAAADTGQLLFVGDSSDAHLTDYQALLRWVAAGNHAVLPVPAEAFWGKAGTDADAKYDDPPVRYIQWLRQTLAVNLLDMDEKVIQRLPKTAGRSTESACSQTLARMQKAKQAEKDEEGRASVWSRDLVNAWKLRCVRQLNQIRLPEGAELVWLDTSAAVFRPLPGASVLWQGQGLSGSHIIRLAYGKGSVVLLSNIEPLGNPVAPSEFYTNDLNHFDHAYLARYLAQGKTRLVFMRQMALADDDRTTSPWWQLWLRQPLLMTVLLAGIILLVWHFGLRVGAVHSDSTEETFHLVTYLHAQGQFLAHHGTVSAKLSNMQAVLWQQWRQRWPDWLQLNHAARLRVLRDYYPHAQNSDLALWLNAIPQTVSNHDWLRYLLAHQRITQYSGSRPS